MGHPLSTPLVIVAETFAKSGYEYSCCDAHTLVLWCAGDGGDYQVTITHCPLFDSVHVQLTFDLNPLHSLEQLKMACAIVADTIHYGRVQIQPNGAITWGHTIPVATVMMGNIDHVLSRAVNECDNLYPLWHGVNAGKVDMKTLAHVVRHQGEL